MDSTQTSGELMIMVARLSLISKATTFSPNRQEGSDMAANPLTENGVQFVLTAVEESLARFDKIASDEKWAPSKIILACAEHLHLQNYSLSDNDAAMVERFLEVSEK